MRNSKSHDSVDSRGRTHRYEDVKQFDRERTAEYRKDHRQIRIANGKTRWLPTELALELLKLPVKDRIL